MKAGKIGFSVGLRTYIPDLRAELPAVCVAHDEYAHHPYRFRRHSGISASFGKLVLVIGDTTERLNVVSAGAVKLVDTEIDPIYDAVHTLLSDEAAWLAMSRAHNPYGDALPRNS